MANKKLTPHPDPEMRAFEEALLLSIDQSQRGQYARVSTPEQITARRAGRTIGSTKAAPKVATTIRLSPDVSSAFRATGAGWQTRIDEALKDWLRTHSPA
jgi:uncharacterized protein (DUF4415 family)